ncbi:MAG TPA: dipeptidase [Gemmatimonadaceae bacterium]|nr:dipeptidase [Gemmatimonadaceae bacterium]
MRLTLALTTAAVVAATQPIGAQASLTRAPVSAATPRDMARALRVLRAAPVLDGHNDLPWRIREDSVHPRGVEAYDLRARTPGMTDLARLRLGHVGGQFWSVYIPGEREDATYAPNGAVSSVPGYARVQLEQIDIARRVIAKYPALRWTPTASTARAAMRDGRVASLLGMEGGHAIENSLAVLRQCYDLGARYMTLTHNVTLDWADAAQDSARHGGLTAFGREVVREMNRLGMLVDLSHVSPGTMSDALDVAEAPVIFSHSGARALVDHRRNVPDSILARMRSNGGVVMVPFVTAFVSTAVKAHEDSLQAAMAAAFQRRGADRAAARADVTAWQGAHPRSAATIADVADQLDHVRRIAGADHVGLGGDFDGISENVVGLEDVSTYPNLFAELVHRGWSDADLAKLANGNVLRVLARAEQVAARLRAARGPSQATIERMDARR